MQLKVKIFDAILTHNTEINSNMDPFIVITVGYEQQRTQILQQAGDMPVFNKQFTFELKHKFQKLHLIIYDEDVTTNDLVGQLQLEIKDILQQKKAQPKWYSLKYDGNKPAGKIRLQFQFEHTDNMNFYLNNIVKDILQPNIHQIGNPKNFSIPSQNMPTSKVHYIGSQLPYQQFPAQSNTSRSTLSPTFQPQHFPIHLNSNANQSNLNRSTYVSQNNNNENMSNLPVNHDRTRSALNMQSNLQYPNPTTKQQNRYSFNNNTKSNVNFGYGSVYFQPQVFRQY